MTYKSTWQLPGHNPPMLVQLSIVPYGANGTASFRISSCVLKKDPSPTIFPGGEVLQLTRPDGDRIVVQKYLDWIAANPGVIPRFDNNNGLFPEYFLEPQGRRKTATELLLDEAMLRVELGDYDRAYIRAQSEEAQTQEKKRRASVVLRYHDSPLLTDTEQAAWKARYLNLPQNFLSWVSSGQRTHLKGSVETDEYEYRLFNLQQSQEWHTDFMGWLNLHAKSSPDFHAEIWQHIHASGIDPERMTPILGDTHTPDGFLVRCDGGPGEYGAVYFWSHEELPVFEKIADSAQDPMPWLATAIREGKPFIL